MLRTGLLARSIAGCLLATLVLLAGCTSSAPATSSRTTPAPPLSPLPRPPAGGGTSTVLHWGAFFGAPGGMYDTLTSPAAVSLPGTVAEVGSSNSTQYALLTNGTLYAWGLGNVGQLGDGATYNSAATAVQVRFPRGVKIAWIPTDAMPYNTGLAVDTTGHVWGWGDNGFGDLCLGSSRIYTTPARLPFGPVTAVAGASNHALYDSAGAVWACGQNVDGDLGDSATANTKRPVLVSGLPASAVTTLVASFANSGALLADGRYYDWGYDAAGQLGNGTTGVSSDIPVPVHLPHPVRQVALGGSYWNNGQTLVKLATGAVWAWGNDEFCQLGDRIVGQHPIPVHVSPLPGVSLGGLATGSGTAYGISAAGDIYAWGVSHVGQVGDGHTVTACTPQRIAAHAAQISATADDAVMMFSSPP